MRRAGHMGAMIGVALFVGAAVVSLVAQWGVGRQSELRQRLCAANLRDIHHGLGLYVADWGSFSGTSMGNWAPPPTLSAPGGAGDASNARLLPYVRDASVFRCPETEGPGGGYALNFVALHIGFGAGNDIPKHLEDVYQESILACEVDPARPLRFGDEILYTAEIGCLSARHGGGQNVLLYDGSVRFVRDAARLGWPEGELAHLWERYRPGREAGVGVFDHWIVCRVSPEARAAFRRDREARAGLSEEAAAAAAGPSVVCAGGPGRRVLVVGAVWPSGEGDEWPGVAMLSAGPDSWVLVQLVQADGKAYASGLWRGDVPFPTGAGWRSDPAVGPVVLEAHEPRQAVDGKRLLLDGRLEISAGDLYVTPVGFADALRVTDVGDVVAFEKSRSWDEWFTVTRRGPSGDAPSRLSTMGGAVSPQR